MSPTHHEKHWAEHPAVPTGSDLTLGERAADLLRGAMGSWGFIFGFLGFMAVWMGLNAVAWCLHWDEYPYILLNLMLSTLAGLQGGILLIAAKRADAVNAALAQHDRELAAKMHALIKEVRDHLKGDADAAR